MLGKPVKRREIWKTRKLKVGANPPIGTATGGKSAAQILPNSDELAQGGNTELWEFVNNMDAKRQKTESEQTELLSNLVFSVAKLQ